MTDFVTVVSGLPRSGTSMMMKMLEAGGLEVLTDGVRTPDEDNPRGYYEFERVKTLREGDDAWLDQAAGKAVKVISELLKWLPERHRYRVLFMERDLSEILASQRAMLLRRGKGAGKTDDARMAELYGRHLARVRSWLSIQPNFDVLYVNYNELLLDPSVGVRRVNEFLGDDLDHAAMADVVDTALYRRRTSSV